jgi:hypothetical protein
MRAEFTADDEAMRARDATREAAREAARQATLAVDLETLRQPLGVWESSEGSEDMKVEGEGLMASSSSMPRLMEHDCGV